MVEIEDVPTPPDWAWVHAVNDALLEAPPDHFVLVHQTAVPGVVRLSTRPLSAWPSHFDGRPLARPDVPNRCARWLICCGFDGRTTWHSVDPRGGASS